MELLDNTGRRTVAGGHACDGAMATTASGERRGEGKQRGGKGEMVLGLREGGGVSQVMSLTSQGTAGWPPCVQRRHGWHAGVHPRL